MTIDCVTGPWSAWSRPDNRGRTTRSRAVIRKPANGGQGCGDLDEEKTGEFPTKAKQVAYSITCNCNKSMIISL